MQTIKDFKEESIKILDEQIADICEEIIEIIDSILTKEVLETLGYTDKQAFLFEIMCEIDSYYNLADDRTKKQIDKLNKKKKEYIELLRKEIFIRIKYKEIILWQNSEDKNNYDIIFLKELDYFDEYLLGIIEIILYDIEEIPFEIILTSDAYGDMDTIDTKLIDIIRKYPTMTSDKIIQRLKLKKKNN